MLAGRGRALGWRAGLQLGQRRVQAEARGLKDKPSLDDLLQSQRDVQLVTEENIASMKVSEMVQLLFHSARKSFNLSQSQIDGVAVNLSRKHVDSFDAQSVSNVMYGLHPYSSRVMDMNKLLMSIAYKVQLCEEELRAQHVGNCMYGLNGLVSNNTSVRKLIVVLAEKIDTCTEELNALEFGNVMYGLRNLSSNHEEVQQLLQVLTSKLETCSEPLTSLQITTSLYGLNSMRSRHDEVNGILRVFADKIRASSCDLDSAAVGSLLGLNKMYSDKPEVRELIEVLSDKIENSTVQMYEPLHIASSLYGLQMMKSTSPKIMKLVDVLATKMDHNCHESFSPETLELALYGIQAMRSDKPEVRHLIRALAKKMDESDHLSKTPKYFVRISSSLSLKSITHIEVRELVRALTKDITSNSQTFLMSDINHIFSNLGHLQSTYTEVTELLKALDSKIKFAIPDCIDISPIMLSLRSLPHNEPWVMDMIAHVTQVVMTTDLGIVKAREVLSALSFLAQYSCDSVQVRNLTLCLLDKFNELDHEDKEDIYVGNSVLRDVVGGLVGIGMRNESLAVAYLEFIEHILESTLTGGSSVVTLDHFSDVLYNFQSMTYDYETESGTVLLKICRNLMGVLDKIKDSKTDIRHCAAALYGLQGLLLTPPSSSDETKGPGAVMCVYFVNKLKKMLIIDDTEINILSCQLNANVTLQHMVLFQYVCRNQIDELNIGSDVEYIVSQLKSKLASRSRNLKFNRRLSQQSVLSQNDINDVVSELSLNTDKDINVFHEECFESCFRTLCIIQVHKAECVAKCDKVVFDPNRISCNFDLSVLPVDPSTSHLENLRDEYLLKMYRSKTIRCEPSESLLRKEMVLEALHSAIQNLLLTAEKE